MIQKLLATALILAALYGCYVLFQEHQESFHRENNQWATALTPLLRLHLTRELDKGGASESSYMSILYYAWQATQDNYGDSETVTRAAAAAGADPAEAAQLGSYIHESVAAAKSMGVFSDPSNPVRMERGEPPVIHKKGWEDEHLVVTNLISPLLAPEAAFAIPNLLLVPESVREMAVDRADDDMVQIAQKWLPARIITPDSYRLIKERATQSR